MSGIFEGIRVIDLTQGMAGSLVTMILADYGAEVIRLEPPGGDPMWEHPAYLLWQRGKKSVALDWDSAEGRAQARRLVEGADIFIETLRPGEAASLGLGYEKLQGANPALIYHSLTPFGQVGPYKDFKLSDGIVNAKSGRMRDQPGWQKSRPTFCATNDLSYHAAMFTLQAVCAALVVRAQTGLGQKLEGTLLSGAAAPNAYWRLYEGQDLPPDLYPNELYADRPDANPHASSPAQICLEARDGRFVIHSHGQVDLFKVWIQTIGFDWIWQNERFKDAPNIVDPGDRIALNQLIAARYKDKTAQEWHRLYRLNPDCVGEVVQSTQDALDHDQVRANGHVIEIDDPQVGRMLQVGGFAAMCETPAVIGAPAPLPGQHTAQLLAEAPRAAPQIVPRGGDPKQPLEGITVLECASWLAAPFGTASLADLGAKVIKVEPLSGDPYRRMPSNDNMVRAFQGKENIALNLKSEQGLEIFYELVKQADIFMHNYRPGAPERLKIDYETLKHINPNLVYVYAGSYGSKGPDRLRAAFAPTIGALTGTSLLQAGKYNRPQSAQSPDPVASTGVGTGMMLGLAARELTGKAQYVETSMINSNLYCNSDDAFRYDGKPRQILPDHAQLGLEATYRLYETSAGWVFLDARFDQEFALLCRALGREELACDERFSAWRRRIDNRHSLGAVLEPLFKTRTAEAWESYLLGEGIACVRADGASYMRFLHTDAQSKALGFMVPTQSPEFADMAPGGRYWRHAPVVRFSRTPCPEGLPYEGLGTYTRRVMRRLGYDDAKIARLASEQVIAVGPGDVLAQGN